MNEGRHADAQGGVVNLRRTGALRVRTDLKDAQENAQRGVERRSFTLQKIAQPFGHRRSTHWRIARRGKTFRPGAQWSLPFAGCCTMGRHRPLQEKAAKMTRLKGL